MPDAAQTAQWGYRKAFRRAADCLSTVGGCSAKADGYALRVIHNHNYESDLEREPRGFDILLKENRSRLLGVAGDGGLTWIHQKAGRGPCCC